MMSPSKSSPEPEHTLTEQVYRSFVRSLGRGVYRHGAPLRIEELARALNVSPTPVREALSRLETTGLIVHAPRRGFRVAPPLGPEQFERLMDARELIEVGAAGLAASGGTADFADSLREALARQSAAVTALQNAADSGPDTDWAVIDADLAFHHVIFDSTDNPFVRVMADSLSGQSHRMRQSAEHGVSDALEAYAEHVAILRAVESRDRQAVESAMRMHMRLVRVRGNRETTPYEEKEQ